MHEKQKKKNTNSPIEIPRSKLLARPRTKENPLRKKTISRLGIKTIDYFYDLSFNTHTVLLVYSLLIVGLTKKRNEETLAILSLYFT